MKFKCPGCESARLEEIMDNVTVASRINDVDKHGNVFHGDQSITDERINRYQCEVCGWVIPNVADSKELYKWLVGHNMI